MENLLKLLNKPAVIAAILGVIVGAIMTRFLPWFFRQFKNLAKAIWHLLTGHYQEKRFEKDYLNHIIERHRYLGLVPTTQVVPKKKGLRLADLERVYTTLSLAPESFNEQPVIREKEMIESEKIMKRKWRFRFCKQIIPDELELGQLIQKHERLVIKGDPGSGKTTLLRYLAVSCARALRANKQEGDDKQILRKRLGWRHKPFPILISLINMSDKKSWNADESLINAFHAQLDPALRERCPDDFFKNKLEKGNCLILLDAFDELGSQRARQAIAEKTGSLARLYKNNSHTIIATARHIGYEGQLDKHKFINYVIQDLDEGSRTRLVRQRYKAIAIEESSEKTKQERQAIEQNYQYRAVQLLDRVKINTHLRELTHNPLLLTLIVLIDAAGIVIPDQRHELYRDCVLVLADTWRRKKLEEARLDLSEEEAIINRNEKVKLLSALAWHMQLKRKEADEHSLIPRSQAQEIITNLLKNEFKLEIPRNEQRPEIYHQRLAQELLEGIRVQSGILVEKGHKRQSDEPLLAFSHLSFQEYLCAACINENKKYRPALFDNLIEPAWQEVVMLYRTISGEEQIIQTMLSENTRQPDGVLLAAACLAEYDHGIEKSTKQKITARLKKQIADFKQHIQTPFLHSFVKIGGIENIDLLLNQLVDQDEVFALRLFDALGSLEIESPNKKEIAIRLLNLLDSPEKLTFKMKVAIGQAIEKLGDPRFAQVEPPVVLIESGEFLYGPKKEKKSIAAFEISKFPITNIEYKRFIDITGYSQPEEWKEGFYPAGKGNHPVVYISKYDAEVYCRWLTRVNETGKKYRLPHEFEWEKAARGEHGKEFPWGDEFDRIKCNSFRQNNGTTPVGIFKDGISDYGVMDAAGNVWEWTDSPYDFFDRIKLKIPILRKNAWSVGRGGSWYYDNEFDFRCANRDDRLPHDRGNDLGFRVVRSAQ